MVYHIITNFSELGGAESALIRIINCTQDKKIVLISLMSVSDSLVQKIKHSDCEVIALNAAGFLSLLLSAFKLCIVFKQHDPKIVYSWMYHANAITALAKILYFKKIQLIWGVRHSLDDYKGEKLSTKIAIQLGRLLRFMPNKVIHCSKKSQLQHEKFGYNTANKSVYIPNGYMFLPLVQRNFIKHKLIIGAAGRFHDAKDYLTLFKAAYLLKQQGLHFQLKVCGRGMTANNSAVIDLIKSAGLQTDDVNLLGEVTDMASFYNELDIFVLSSKTEGFPNVLAEAAGAGAAVFSTDVGDASVIVNNSEHIVAIKDFASLARCIYQFIMKAPAEKQQIVAITTQYVRDNFSIATIAKQFSEV